MDTLRLYAATHAAVEIKAPCLVLSKNIKKKKKVLYLRKQIKLFKNIENIIYKTIWGFG